MKKIFVLLSLCVLFSLSRTLSYEKTGPKSKELILKNKVRPADKNFFGLLLVPYIICFFAATGIWPHYPQYMQNSVNEMGQQVFSQSDEHIQNFCRGKFLFNAQAHRPVFFKGIFFPFAPIEEWPSKTTKIVEKTTMRERPTPAETKETEATTETTVTTTKATTVPTTTLPPETTTPEPTTTTPDTSVVTFDPNQPVTVICNCSQPKLVNSQANVTTVKIEKSINTIPLTTGTAAPTQPTHIKIEVKNVISFIDLILSYLNLTRSNQ
ncbi:uncharacterized protein LOC119067387 [Bradysia coprophila]|uniref:uncharacterized protein LOC119067387 n=1 Tax=Bradysia coprophila TaxID=38358 RepID=UPI00187D7668|nr:uncharacterized protein LOC119067387 [Bradysia coprophila]